MLSGQDMTGDANRTTVTRNSRLHLWPLGLVAVFMGFALFGERGILHLVKLVQQKDALVQTLGEIETQNEDLRREIVALRSDRRYIERLARTELGMVREDELVFQFSRPATTRDEVTK